MNKTAKILVILLVHFVALNVFAEAGFATTVYVANYGDGSPSLANVQAAYNDAVTGDIIEFPANGVATWDSALTIGKAVTIFGAGTTLTASGPMWNGFFHITGFTSSELVRITRFTFQMNDFTPRFGIKITSVSLDKLRIDHNTFHFGSTPIEVHGSKGVIDHNYFYNGNTDIYYTAGTVAQANAAWTSMAAGTANALFIEDNHFIANASFPGAAHNNNIDTFNGGRLVIRYNEFDSDNNPLATSAYTIQAHGSALGGAHGNDAAFGYWQRDPTETGARRGQSVIEVYNNNFHGKRIDFPVVLRGSSSLVYNNTHNDVFGSVARFYMYEEEYYESSNWSPLRTAWPAEDQVHNTFLWGNILDGVPQTSANVIVVPDADAGLKENRDYFLHAPQATGGKATFTGLNGASGSYPTDGTKYPTLGTMVFSATGANAHYPYTAYTYPHPLTIVTSQRNSRGVTQ